MTTLSIQPPFPLITDIDGQPLEDGYIWIGTANLPPIGNPIAVYWDAALTIPAALPIRTRGGYPVNAGTPARLYVNSDYSILVQNKNGSTLYSAPDGASDRFSAAQISFLQAGAGAVVRTAQSKMRDVVSVFDFMTAAQIADVQAGTASIDVTAEIQNAINSLASGGTVYIPHGTYYLASSLSLANNINIVGAGKTATILRIAANGITFTGQSFCRISDLRFTGTGGSPGVAIYFASGNTSNILIENVFVALCANAIKNAPVALITVMQVIGCYFTDMNDWQVDLPAGTFNGLTFEDTRFENTTAAGGLRATNLQYSRFHGCIFESLAGSTGAVQLNNCQAYFHQCLFFNNARGITGGSDVYIGTGNQGLVHIYDCNFGPAASNAVNHTSVKKVVSINTLLRIENCYVNIDSVSDSFVALSANPDSIYLITNKFAGTPASGQFVYRNNTLKGGDIKELSAINGGVAYSQKVDLIRCSIQTTDNITKSIWGGVNFGPISSYPAKDCYVLYEATVLCRESTGVDYGAWNIKELFQVVDAGSGNFTITSVSTAWSDTPIRSTASLVVGFGVTANNTSSAGVELTVRGLAATTINWTASVKFTAVL